MLPAIYTAWQSSLHSRNAAGRRGRSIKVFGQLAQRAGDLIIAGGTDEFLGAGFGFRVKFKGLPPGYSLVGIVAVEERQYKNGEWVPGRRLNGDETGRGHWWRLLDYVSSDGRPFTATNKA